MKSIIADKLALNKVSKMQQIDLELNNKVDKLREYLGLLSDIETIRFCISHTCRNILPKNEENNETKRE